MDHLHLFVPLYFWNCPLACWTCPAKSRMELAVAVVPCTGEVMLKMIMIIEVLIVSDVGR